jgi:hypothetical protein
LQDRASLLEKQISAHEAQFEKRVAQMKAEHEARLKDLGAEFDVITKLHELEQRRLDKRLGLMCVPDPPAKAICRDSVFQRLLPSAAASSSGPASNLSSSSVIPNQRFMRASNA